MTAISKGHLDTSTFLPCEWLCVVQWNSGNVIQLGWSGSEDLLCVQDDGSILVYDLFGTFKRTFSMGQVRKDILGDVTVVLREIKT